MTPTELSERYHLLRIEGGPIGHDVQFWLDGVPLKGVRRFDLRGEAGEVLEFEVSLTVRAQDVITSVSQGALTS